MPSSATEGTMFMALADDWVGGVPELTATVIELLPEEADAGGATIAMHELPELADGQGYRPVLTNHRGLYRYLMEDVFYVEGWHRGVPIMRFSHRHGMTSSLTGEKLTEVQVLAALDSAASSAGVDVSEAQLAPEWGSPPRYLLLVQPRRPAGRAALRALLIAFENTLAGSNPEYDHKRRSGRLAPPQLLVVGREVFERMRTDMTSGRSDAQAKISRLRRDVLARDTLEVDAVVTLREEDQA
jgi:hypothetical protein